MVWRWCRFVQRTRRASADEFSAKIGEMHQQQVEEERKAMVLEAKVYTPLAEPASGSDFASFIG